MAFKVCRALRGSRFSGLVGFIGFVELRACAKVRVSVV